MKVASIHTPKDRKRHCKENSGTESSMTPKNKEQIKNLNQESLERKAKQELY